MESINGAGEMVDFNSVDYVTKNIRVQCENEMVERDDKSGHDSKMAAMLGERVEEDEEKYNSEILFELNSIRDVQKEEKRIAEQRALIEAQKAEKLKSKKGR